MRQFRKFSEKTVSQRIYYILVDEKCVYFAWGNPRDSTVYNVQKPIQLLLTVLLRNHDDFERISPKNSFSGQFVTIDYLKNIELFSKLVKCHTVPLFLSN